MRYGQDVMAGWAPYFGEEPFASLVGKTLTEILRNPTNDVDDCLVFVCDDGERYAMFHVQSCCESVDLDDVAGDLADLIGSPILTAEDVSNSDDPPKEPSDADYGTYTWTFYKVATIKGSVTLRWYGSSNGYYSEDVSFKRLRPVGSE